MYKIKIANFEGPFDLLLYFIKRDELNIYDIPIAQISDEFLKFIRLMELMDLELAGEFLVMSSTLMLIKSQMLLPKNNSEVNNDAEDPRTELVQKLLEYKQIKHSADKLKNLEEENRYNLYRNNFQYEESLASSSADGYKVTLYDLMNAVNKLIERKTKTEILHKVSISEYTLEDLSNELIKSLTIKSKLYFTEYFSKAPKAKIVVAFLAILDLIRSNQIELYQSDIYGDILITKTQNLN